jgi:azurin
MRALMFALAAALAAATPLAGAPADPAPRTVTIGAGDDMKFSVTEVTARRGERLRIVLRSSGTMPKAVMSHNVVVLAKGTDVNAFINASVMARDAGFVAPSFAKQILAATPLAGNGETVEVTFKAPSEAGRYDFVCSFPGHFQAGMRGTLVVK